jgi:hypothetical protein
VSGPLHRLHRVYADVADELVRHPTASANEIDRMFRAAAKGYWRNDVLRAVLVLRKLPTTPQSALGPGRPQKSVPGSSGGSEEGVS